jgi:hypothetical protein
LDSKTVLARDVHVVERLARDLTRFVRQGDRVAEARAVVSLVRERRWLRSRGADESETVARPVLHPSVR